MAASSTATDGTTAAYDTAAYGTPHNKDPCPLQQVPFQDYLPLSQQGLPFGRQQVQRNKSTRNKAPVCSELPSPSNVLR